MASIDVPNKIKQIILLTTGSILMTKIVVNCDCIVQYRFCDNIKLLLMGLKLYFQSVCCLDDQSCLVKLLSYSAI